MFKKTIPYSLGIGIVNIAMFYIQYTKNIHYQSNMTYGLITLFATILLITIGIKNNLTSDFKIRDGIKVGVAISVMSGIIYWIYQTIHTTIIEPEFKYNMLEVKIKDHLKFFPKTTPEEIAVLKTNFIDGFNINNFAGIILPSLVAGLIISLICSAYFKFQIQKKR